MRVSAENGIHTRNATGHLHVNVHAVVRKYDYSIRLFGRSYVIDHFLHIAITDAKRPVRNKPARIGDRRIWKCLSDNRDSSLTHFANRVRLECVARVFVERCCTVEQGLFRNTNILRDKLTIESLDVLQHFFIAIGEFPMAGHDINTQ